MSLNGKSVLSGQERGFIRLVAREDNEKIVGAQLMCARATDMIGELALAISRGITAGELAGVIHPHPTFGEGIGCLLYTSPIWGKYFVKGRGRWIT